MNTTYCNNCGLLHDSDDGECLGCILVKSENKLKVENEKLKKEINSLDKFQKECSKNEVKWLKKLKAENEKLKEFVKDCSVSHVESRYKYRAQVLLRGAERNE